MQDNKNQPLNRKNADASGAPETDVRTSSASTSATSANIDADVQGALGKTIAGVQPVQEKEIPIAQEKIAKRVEDAEQDIARNVSPDPTTTNRRWSSTKKDKNVKLPSIPLALLPIVCMVCLMVYVFGITKSEIYDAAHLPLACSIVVCCLVGFACGHSFKSMLQGMLDQLMTSMESILILCTVGFLISAFMISGTIPALIYYGLVLLTPQTFLPIGCLLCAIVGMACGSSWTATATIGVAFMTIGTGLGINPAITAGMIISGAYVGDKLSPLSDTTNLAAAVAGTGLFDHVRAMITTTLPVFIIALVLYTAIGANTSINAYDPTVVEGIRSALAEHFNMNPLVLLPIVVIIAACVMRLDGLVGITISVVVGIIFCLIFQQQLSLGETFEILHYGPAIETGNEYVDAALAKGGLENQMWTISLILLAVCFGGALARCGAVAAIFNGLKERLTTSRSVVWATLGTSLFCDAVMCDQYLGIGVPAPLYASKYDDTGMARNMLSRSLEDSGTMWAAMFPWTACGAYQMGVLGLSPFAYFPFAFVNLLSPIYSAITVACKRNIFWADGSYTNIFGKTKMGKVAQAPEAAQKAALANLERLRAQGVVPALSVAGSAGDVQARAAGGAATGGEAEGNKKPDSEGKPRD